VLKRKIESKEKGRMDKKRLNSSRRVSPRMSG
jgi:hypothetical protein